MDLLEVNTVVSEMKNTVGGMNSRLDVTEEKINKHDDVVIETKLPKLKCIVCRKTLGRKKKKKPSMSELRKTLRDSIYLQWQSRNGWAEKVFEEIMAENILNLMESINLGVSSSAN